jgi:hypothetical protein
VFVKGVWRILRLTSGYGMREIQDTTRPQKVQPIKQDHNARRRWKKTQDDVDIFHLAAPTSPTCPHQFQVNTLKSNCHHSYIQRPSRPTPVEASISPQIHLQTEVGVTLQSTTATATARHKNRHSSCVNVIFSLSLPPQSTSQSTSVLSP